MDTVDTKCPTRGGAQSVFGNTSGLSCIAKVKDSCMAQTVEWFRLSISLCTETHMSSGSDFLNVHIGPVFLISDLHLFEITSVTLLFSIAHMHSPSPGEIGTAPSASCGGQSAWVVPRAREHRRAGDTLASCTQMRKSAVAAVAWARRMLLQRLACHS